MTGLNGRFGCFQREAAERSAWRDSSDSETENEAKGQLLPKKPAWVDEDDEAEEK